LEKSSQLIIFNQQREQSEAAVVPARHYKLRFRYYLHHCNNIQLWLCAYNYKMPAHCLSLNVGGNARKTLFGK